MARATPSTPSGRWQGTPETASVKFNRVLLAIVALGALVIVAFAGSSAYDAWRSYRYSINAAQREINNVANALAEQTAWSLEAVDLLLLDTAQSYRTDSVPADRIDAALSIRITALPQVRRISIIDAQGTRRHVSGGTPPGNLNIADRSSCPAHRDGSAVGLFMSEPLVSRADGRAVVILSRRLDDEHGNF